MCRVEHELGELFDAIALARNCTRGQFIDDFNWAANQLGDEDVSNLNWVLHGHRESSHNSLVHFSKLSFGEGASQIDSFKCARLILIAVVVCIEEVHCVRLFLCQVEAIG